MPRANLDQSVVIARAARLLDDGGVEALTLTALAEALGVRVPSLYKHIDGLPGVRRGIMLRAKSHLADALGAAAVGKSRADAVSAIAAAYRNWALTHPGQYPLTVRAPSTDDVDDVTVSARLVTIVFDVMAGYRLHADDAVDATRFLRAAVHGFVALETSGAFELPADRERSYAALVKSVTTALESW